jgi:hypothetical protein
VPTPTEALQKTNEIIEKNGLPVTITTYTTSTFNNTGYDDEQLISASGTTISGGGVLLPLGASDKQYVEQGLADWNDSKLYLTGSLTTNPNMQVRVGNNGSLYHVLQMGIKKWAVSGTVIYQTCFVRKHVSGQHPGLT